MDREEAERDKIQEQPRERGREGGSDIINEGEGGGCPAGLVQ